MKKFLALALAIAMIVSLSSVAMAADTNAKFETGGAEEYTVKVEGNKNDKYEVADDDVYGPIVGLYGPFSYDSEDRALYDAVDHKTNGKDGVYGPVEFGEAAYYAIINFVPDDDYVDSADLAEDDDEYEFELTSGDIDDGNGKFLVVKDSEVVSNLKIKTDWEEGGDLVKSIKVVKRKIVNYTKAADGDFERTDSDYDEDYYYPTLEELGLTRFDMEKDDYVYFLVVEYEESNSHNDADLIGTVTLNKSKHPKVDELELDIGFSVDWEYNYRTGAADYTIDGDPSFEFAAEKNYALKFDCDEEVELTFDDESTFTVDVSGQSKILFNWNNNYISKVAAKYPYAELNFWNGNGAKFNRVGEFFFNCEDLEGNQFLYQVNADGTLSEVPGAEWDDSDEGFYFNTRVLGSYVVSDMELDVATVQPSVSAPSAPAPVVTNPATGVEG